MYMVKKRTALSHEIMATLFGVSCTSRVSGHLYAVRRSLSKNFTVHHIGFEAIPREDVISKYTTDLARILFADGKDDVMILIMDGTYIYLGIHYYHHCMTCFHTKGRTGRALPPY